MDRELLLQNIIRYCTKANVFPTQACVEANVGKDFVSDIKRGRMPSVAKVAALAAYLGVTTSDLVGDARDAQPISPTEARFTEYIIALEQMPKEQREMALRTLAALVGKAPPDPPG